jgi:hypothetical protein
VGRRLRGRDDGAMQIMHNINVIGIVTTKKKKKRK